MIKFLGLAGVHLVGVLTVIPASVIGTGIFVVSSLAAPAKPAPTIGTSPASPSTSASATFMFTSTKTPTRYLCALDTLTYSSCSSPKTYSGLSQARHCLNVFAEDARGYKSSTLQNYCWTIVAPRGFTVGGDLTTPLFPGTSQPLDLTFTNPDSAPVTIPAGGITAANITITSTAPGCASSNFAVKRGLTAAVTIPASPATPVSLSGLHVPRTAWPVIAMLETNTNQDACQGAHLTLTYAGIEATG